MVEGLPGDVVRPPIVITTSGLDLQSRCDPRLFAHAGRQAAKDGRRGLAEVDRILSRPRSRAAANPKPEDIAFLVYTSGTTGVPKAAMNAHANVAFAAQSISRWYSLKDGDSILALAPLFHVTGLVVHVAMSWRLAAPLILAYRFEPGVVLDALVEHKPAFTVSAITAFIALMNHPDCTPLRFASLRVVVSGGAPIPRAWSRNSAAARAITFTPAMA